MELKTLKGVIATVFYFFLHVEKRCTFIDNVDASTLRTYRSQCLKIIGTIEWQS